MGVKAVYIDEIFNKIYAKERLVIEFDGLDETVYLRKELNRRIKRTDKIMTELEGDVEENRVGLNWITFGDIDNPWPRQAEVFILPKEEVIKTFGFRIITPKSDE